MRELLEYEEEVPGRPGWIQINYKKVFWKNDSRKSRGAEEIKCPQCSSRLSDFDMDAASPWDWQVLCWKCKEKWWQPYYQWWVDKDMKFYLWRWRWMRRILRTFDKKAKITPPIAP